MSCPILVSSISMPQMFHSQSLQDGVQSVTSLCSKCSGYVSSSLSGARPKLAAAATRSWEILSEFPAKRVLATVARAGLRTGRFVHAVVSEGYSKLDDFIERREVAKKSGELWEAVSRRRDTFGGFVYVFHLKRSFDDLTPDTERLKRREAAEARQAAIFPALEKLGSDLVYLDSSFTEEQLVDIELARKWDELSPEDKQEYAPRRVELEVGARPGARAQVKMYRKNAGILRELGYRVKFWSDGGIELHMPDREALLARWDLYRDIRPWLPSLDIFSCSGMMPDLDLVKAFFNHDVILSTGQEFVHDQLLHVMPMIGLKLASGVRGNPTFEQEKERLVHLVNKVYLRVMIAKMVINDRIFEVPEYQLQVVRKHTPKIEAALGALVDTILGESTYTFREKFSETFIENYVTRTWDLRSWKNYWSHRFGAENIQSHQIAEAWEYIKGFEEKFDALRTAGHGVA